MSDSDKDQDCTMADDIVLLSQDTMSQEEDSQDLEDTKKDFKNVRNWL